ncbi:MAG: SAV_2336 N-terminal domain-related protein [Microcystis panniformis]
MSDASASVKPDRFKRLLKTLNQSELEMTSYELADLCWLLLHLPQIVETAESKTEGEIKDISSQSNSSSSAISVGNDVNKKNNEEAAGLFPRRPEQDSFVGGSGSLTFPVDNPSDLGGSLSLARALKTLLRRVPTQDRPSILDEVRTVESFAAADQKILAPVFKPTLEPWLELALVFDRGSSMDIWHQTLTDLKNALQHYGIFSNVQVWQLILTENNLTLHRELAKANSRVYHPKELLNPNGRRLIVVVSDCVASYWQDGKMFPLLKLWGQSSPLAILQMLPEWLWLKTGLGLGAKVTLFSDEPGLTNSRLKIRDVLLWENVIREQNRLQIPVFTLEPLSVERWSGVVVGRSDTKVAGFVLTPDTKEELEPDTELNLTPEEIVRRFRNNASLLAQELAELLAATPTIFLPVVRLIRKEMLPEAGQVQIAEVFLGGILRVRSLGIKESDPDAVLYDFINPEVRKILQRSSTRSTTVDVFDRVSKYIAKQLNLELREFLAELKKPPTEIGEDIQGIIRPFAEVAARILRNLGGNYLAIAQQLEQASVATPLEVWERRLEPVPVQPNSLKTILLVEDQAEVIEEISILLSSQYGITVRGTADVNDVNEVINIAQSGEIDFILVNDHLPNIRYQGREVNGIKLVRLLRSNPKISPYLPIIGFSHHISKKNEFLQEADGFYSKADILERKEVQQFIDYLRKIFNRVKLTEILPYESAENVDLFLDSISKQHLEGKDTFEEEVASLLGKPKGDDGIYYLLENLCLLNVLDRKSSHDVEPGTVRYDFSANYLNQQSPRPLSPPEYDEFNERLSQLHPGQRELLDLIEKRNATQQTTTMADAAPLFFTHPEGGDVATYRRLEHLQLLGFLTIADIGTGRDSLRYNLSLKFQKYLAYTQLRELLAAGRWKEADAETARLMLQVAGRKGQGWLSGEDLKNFPSEDLRIINQLWLDYSNGKFGFSIQKEIYQSLGGTREYNEEIWKRFGERIGWKRGDKWLIYSDLTYNLDAPLGYLPSGKLTSENYTPPPGHFPPFAEKTRERESVNTSSRYLLALLTRSDLFSWKVFNFDIVSVDSRGREVKHKNNKTARYYTETIPSSPSGGVRGEGIPLEMVAIPGGTFTMGTEDEEIERLVKKFNWEGFRWERPQHRVTVSSFYMGRYPITQAQWKAIAATAKIDIDLETNPSHFKGDELPVETVNGYQATEFCKRLSRETKREYRLPSEAEWEYACRAGTTTPFYFGETITGELANYNAGSTYAEEAKGEYRQQTTPVGQFPPNAFGLYDMHGNVSEWCADTWHYNYDGAPTDGSAWIENGNDNLSSPRGGSWYDDPYYCRSAYCLNYLRRDFGYYHVGFRVVCGAGRTL